MKFELLYYPDKTDHMGFQSFLQEEEIREVVRGQYIKGQWSSQYRAHTYHKIKKNWFSTKYEEFLYIDQFNKKICIFSYCQTASIIIQFLKRLNIVNDEYSLNFCGDYPIVRSRYEI
jgi:hypothetical protein